MNIQFRTLQYQLDAVNAVVNCFIGQPKQSVRYLVDRGRQQDKQNVQTAFDFHSVQAGKKDENFANIGFANAPLENLEAVLANLQRQQAASLIEKSETLITDDNGKNKNLTSSRLNLDIEMETGTGKTYCYIRTMFELNKRYGWSKFIVVVPSIAIREGVFKTLEMTAEHFQQEFGQKARAFIYSSKALHQLESFSSDAAINIMVINVQAFNATGKDNRRIYDELDEFQSRRPIDVIKANRPILILDEPQKMQAEKTLKSLADFNPLFILRYSATHKRQYNLVYRLDALDAYNQKLVKSINVKGIKVNHLKGTDSYLYLQQIEVSKSAPTALVELEQQQASGFKRLVRRVKKGDDLFALSNEAKQYKSGFVVSEINARDGTLEFTNGTRLTLGEATGDVNEATLRQLQIRETIAAHFAKEQTLFKQGIKALSLFFIDEVAKYRQYDAQNTAQDGDYVAMFKQEYAAILRETLAKLSENDDYARYLKKIDVNATHNGYFSVDKKTKRLTDPELDKKNKEEQIANDKDAYDLILKDKTRLLSFDEPTRFIFSHSALREGWDNPNVFTLCTLKHSDNNISRRQEIGRGLRLAVNKLGERMDAKHFGKGSAAIHQLNELTVITDESYEDFVKKLQEETIETLKSRPVSVSESYFIGKTVNGVTLTYAQAKAAYFYFVLNKFIDINGKITEAYQTARKDNTLPELPEQLAEVSEGVLMLMDNVLSPNAIGEMFSNATKKVPNPVNQANLSKPEFQRLWQKINRKAVYQIALDSEKLIADSIEAIDAAARERANFVERLSYTIGEAVQKKQVSYEDLQDKTAFTLTQTRTEMANLSANASTAYDLVGEIADKTNLTRKTVVAILKGIQPNLFAQYPFNPEAFIRKLAELINRQQAQMILQGLHYQPLGNGYLDNEIFISNDVKRDAFAANRHIWDFVPTDSDVETRFAEALDKADEVVVYAKLPDNFKIPTPFGNYNPDWAIAFKQARVKKVYFVAETKGSANSGSLRDDEKHKIDCARKFFSELNASQADGEKVQYDVVSNYAELWQMLN